TAGATAGTGAAGTGATPPHASSGGCAVGDGSAAASVVGLVAAALAWLGARRSSRRRRSIS
ncbi:MAG TPA: carbohydrate-binding protein, partial [Polyangia bacterium]|nr:carbohydrate-binding protein [Polyangia bacterium]